MRQIKTKAAKDSSLCLECSTHLQGMGVYEFADQLFQHSLRLFLVKDIAGLW